VDKPEVLASDLWEDALNLEPAKLGMPALKGEGAQELKGIDQKQISVDFLAKHGYNLSSVMGSLLKPKFDFTSVQGIEKAYRTLLGQPSVWTQGVHDSLFVLEQTRHLIQHRAGIVDQKFIETN